MQVLKQSSVEHIVLIYRFSKFTFLDEFRLLIPARESSLVGDIGLVVFDTSIPQQSPDSWRHFYIAPTPPQDIRNLWPWGIWVYRDVDRMQGEGSCDGPLIVDPAQSVVAFVLYRHECGGPSSGEVVSVIRIAALVGYMSSTHTGQHIPWDDWKRDVMVVEIPPSSASLVRTFVFGSRVLLLMDDWRDNTGGYSIWAYDFNLRGCRTLVRAGDRKNKRKVTPNPKKIWFPPGYDNAVGDMRAMGDSLVSCMVSDSQENLGLKRAYVWYKSTVFPNDIYVWEFI